LTSLEPAGLSTGTTRPCVASPCGWFTQASGRGNDDRRLPEVADLQLRHPAVLVVPDDALVREVGQVRAQTVEVTRDVGEHVGVRVRDEGVRVEALGVAVHLRPTQLVGTRREP